MPPRRKPPSQPRAKAQSARQQLPQPSKLAKSLSLTAAEEAEILAAFELFADQEDEDGEAAMPTEHVRKAFMALDLPLPGDDDGDDDDGDLADMLDMLDPASTGLVPWPRFLELAGLRFKINHYPYTAEGENEGDGDGQEEEEEEAEVRDAFALFAKDRDAGEITIDDLRRLAEELKEDVSAEQLRDMIAVANGGRRGRGVDIGEFEVVMRRAGVF